MSEFPFMYPGMYSPGQMAFNNNAELSQLISMFSGPLLGAMAGPGHFVPHMMPGQAIMDQFAMRNYQNQTRAASFNMAAAGPQNNNVANLLLGLRGIATKDAPTAMNHEQAMSMAQVLNNPVTKTFAGMMMGPENVEMMLHGSRGDIQSLGNTVNRIGYFRKDPSGEQRMTARGLEDFTTGVFSHLYEPEGDVEGLGKTARRGGAAGQKAITQLQTAADMHDRHVVSDEEVQGRLKNSGATKVEQLYKKYVQGGTATDIETQAKELTKFDRAIKESKVLGSQEATIGQLETAAIKRPAAEMHGLTAGQAGQLMENLFQRGVLPPSVGNLDAKGKVNAIAETKLDDGTLQRLAETMARRNLEKENAVGSNNKRFSDMSADEQQDEIKKVSGTYKEQIAATKAAADDAAAGKAGAMSAEKIMQMSGGAALAGNVDADRTSSKLKDYAEAVSAVRDIFGDNGNPNAPMPALMAALDHLTQGGMGTMDPKLVASTLRQMQTMARETGTGMQQMAAMSAQAGAIGQQLGLAPSITTQNVAMSIGMTKTAMDRGAFSGDTPGAMTKEQFQKEAIDRLQYGDASDNAKAMAAMRRVYESDPKKFEGTELEAAVDAYTNRASGGNYTYDPTPDKPKSGDEIERNLFENVGRGGHFETLRLLEDAGATEQSFYSAAYDPRTMHEFGVSGTGYMTQKHQILRDLSAMGAGGMVENALEDTAIGNELGDEGRMAAADALTEMVFDSSDMKVENQLEFLQKNMPQKLTQQFIKQGMKKPAAEKRAQQVIDEVFSDGKGGIDRTRLDQLIGNVGTVAQEAYGQNLVQLNQLYGNGGDTKAMQEMARSQAHSAATSRLTGLGSESTPMGRAADYFMDIGKRGESFNLDQFVKELAPFVNDKELLQRYAGGMGAGMHTLAAMRDKVQVTEKHINKLADDGNIDELKRLGGVGADEVVVDKTTLDNERTKKIDALATDRKKLQAAYKATSGKTGAGMTTAEIEDYLRNSDKFKYQSDKEYLEQQQVDTGKRHITTETLKTRAMRSVEKALQGMEGTHEDIETVQQAIFNGDNKDARKDAVGAISRLFREQGGAAGKLAGDKESLEKIINANGKDRENLVDDMLKQFGMSRETFEKNKSLDTDKKSTEQQLAEIVAATAESDEMQQLGKVADGQTAQAVTQRADKVELDATNVYINGAKAETGPAPAGSAPPAKESTPPAAAAPAGTAGPQPTPSATPAAGAADSAAQKPLADAAKPDTPAQKTVSAETATAPTQQPAAAPAASTSAAGKTDKPEQRTDAAPSHGWQPPPPKQASTPQDKPLHEIKTADKDPKTAAAVRQQTDTAAVAAVGMSPSEAKKIIGDMTAGSPAAEARKAAVAAVAKKNELYDDLSPAEQEEVEYYKETQQRRKLIEKIKDPKTSPAEKQKANAELKDLKESSTTSAESVVGLRMAEAAGIDVSAGLKLQVGEGTGMDTTVTVNGQRLNAKEFQRQVSAMEATAAEGGDTLSDKSRSYMLAEADAEKKKLVAADLEKEQVATRGSTDLRQKSALSPPEAAEPKQKYDIDPREFTQSVSQADGSYASISGQFRDRDGQPIARPTDSEYFDAMHIKDQDKDDPLHRTGRVGQIGEKYYEEYKAAGIVPAWREVSVGENKTAAETVAEQNDAALTQHAGSGLAGDMRARGPATQLSAARNELAAAKNKQTELYNELTPAEQEEVNFHNETQKQRELQKKIKDPNTPPEEKAKARQELKNEKDLAMSSAEDVVALRMAEAAGVDLSAEQRVHYEDGTDKEAAVSVNGVELDAKKFKQQVAELKDTIAGGGDPLSDKSRQYVEAATEASKKQADLQQIEKTQTSARNDGELQQKTSLPGGEEQSAVTAEPEQKYDIDPRDFTQSVSQADGSYASISGPFRDREGKAIDKPTDGEYFDALHTVARDKDDQQGRTGRVGQIGDKYYEEYKAGGVTPAWREVSVGENKTEAEKIAAQNDAALTQQAGSPASDMRAGVPASDMQAHGPATQLSAAKKELQAAQIKRAELYENLSPAERAEAGHYRTREKMESLQKTIDDPNKSADERYNAREILDMLGRGEELELSGVVARRMAEEQGIDSSGKVSINNGQPSIGGVPLDRKKFNQKLEEAKTIAAEQGDVLSGNSRQYALATFDVRKKKREVTELEKGHVAAQNDAALTQQAGVEQSTTTTPAGQTGYTRDNQLDRKKPTAFKNEKERDAAWDKLTPEEKKQIEVVRSKEILAAGERGGHKKETVDAAYKTMEHGMKEIAARRAAVDAGIIGKDDEAEFKYGGDYDVTINGQKIDAESFQKHYQSAAESLDTSPAAFMSTAAKNFDNKNYAMQAAAAAREADLAGGGEMRLPAKAEEEQQKVAETNDETLQQSSGQTPDETAAARAEWSRQRQKIAKNYSKAASGNRLAQLLIDEEATDAAAEAGTPSPSQEPTALPPEKTAGVQQASADGRLGSANIHPAVANPEQQPRGGEYTPPGQAAGGGGDKGSITLNGSLRLEGLHEAILDATGQKAVATPGGGVPVVGGGNMGRGGMPSGQRVT